jgi:phosphoglycerol transferase MdoB-like AlkP superfamily enzyme
VIYILTITAFIFTPTSLQQLVFSFYDINKKSLSNSANEKLLENYNIKSLIPKNDLISTPGKNLVIIYLESIESIYLDETIFPGLVPNLQGLSKEGLTFTNLKQFHNTSFTTAAIIANQCGLPLLDRLHDVNSIFAIKKDYMKNLPCLGDVLNKAGYYQVYMGGADIDFGGKRFFLQNHGYDLILGRDQLKNDLPIKNYLTAWGLYDDSLFNLALPAFKKLASMDKPFNLTLLTLDTHIPGGETSFSCPKYKKINNSILNAVHCTDYLVGKFISEIKKEPRYKDTVVALMSDHIAPSKVATKLYPPATERKMFATFLNTGKKGNIDVLSSPFDFAPTILNIVNVNSNAEFLLGENVLDNPSSSRLDIAVSNDAPQLVEYVIKQFSNNDFGEICSENNGIKGYERENLNLFKILFSTNEKWVKLEYMFFRGFIRSLWIKIGKSRKIEDYGISNTADILNAINQDKDFAYFILSYDQEIDLSSNNHLITKSSPGFYYFYIKNPYKPEANRKGKFESLNQLNINKNACKSLFELG